ncbi:hypothetical protein JCM10213v2_001393 [Rhodosporidiobolus nylandii]
MSEPPAPPVSPTSPSTSLQPAQRPRTNARDPDRPPRPMNAWLLFRTAQLRQIQEDNPGMRKSQGELSKIISEMWKKCDGEVRAGYEALAKERKAEHARLYPDYRYAPDPKTSAPSTSAGKAPKVKHSPSTSRKPALRLSPSSTASTSSFSPTPNHSALRSAEPQYNVGGDDTRAYGALPTPAPLSYVPYEDSQWTPPQTASFGGFASGAVARRISRPHAAVPHPSAYEQQQQGAAAFARGPASAPPTVTRFGGVAAGRSLGLTFASDSTEQGEPGSAYSSPFPPSVLQQPHAYSDGESQAYALPPAPSTSFPSRFAYVSPSQYMSPPASATHPALASSSTEPAQGAYSFPPPHNAPMPLQPSQPPRPQLRATYSAALTMSGVPGWAPRGSVDEPPPSPFTLPPQQHGGMGGSSVEEQQHDRRYSQPAPSSTSFHHLQQAHYPDQPQQAPPFASLSPSSTQTLSHSQRPHAYSHAAPMPIDDYAYPSQRPQHPRTSSSYSSLSSASFASRPPSATASPTISPTQPAHHPAPQTPSYHAQQQLAGMQLYSPPEFASQGGQYLSLGAGEPEQQWVGGEGSTAGQGYLQQQQQQHGGGDSGRDH